MSLNQYYHRPFEQQSPEEIPFSPINKQSDPQITPIEPDGASQNRARHAKHSRSLWKLLCNWKWEIATWLLGSCALGCIVALLVHYQDRSLEDWAPPMVDISLATVVAVLSQVAQSAFLYSVSSCIGQLKWDWLSKKRPVIDLDRFEEASRGPKGSLLLLLKTKLHFVSVGACVTILLLAFSAFAVQSNNIRIRAVPRPGDYPNVTISRSVQYMNSEWNTNLVQFDPIPVFNNSRFNASTWRNFHPHMYRAMLSGVLDEDKSVSDIEANCSVDVCKWTEYTTLAICAEVEDISNDTEIDNDYPPKTRVRLSGESWEPPTQLTNSPDTFWMTAPFNISPEVLNENLPPVSSVYVAYLPTCNKDGQPWGGANEWTDERDKASNWKAFKGTLSLCLQTLSSTYNNTMQTTVNDECKDLKWNSNGTNSESTAVCLTQPYKGEKFCVGQDDLNQWSAALQQTIESAAMLQEGGDNYYTGQWVPNLVADIMGPTPTLCDPNLGPGYGLEGFTRRINNIAIAMSNALRTGNKTSPDSFVAGSEWITEQYIEVDFKWLSLPGVIFTMVTFFLLTTIARSRKRYLPLWKSSPLVLLHVADHSNGLQSLEKVRENAKETQVQLQYTGENWHLEDVSGKPT